MGVVRAYPMHLMPAHPLKAHPNVCLDVLHHVAKVKLAVGVGQGGGDEDVALLQRGVGRSGMGEIGGHEGSG